MKTAQIPSILIIFCLFFTQIISQAPMHIKASCNFATTQPDGDLYTYQASKEAVDIVEKILKALVLPQNFIIKSADCKNALAATEGKQRYILYSTTFLENFKKDAQTQWAAYCVLAHEIGHHLSYHDLEETDMRKRKTYELEADKFAGGALFKLGATLEQAQAGINSFSLEGETATHPSKKARLEAIAVGWKQAQEMSENAAPTEGVANNDSEEKKLYHQAMNEKDAKKAIALLDQAIELKDDYADAYLQRGRLHIELDFYKTALEDFNTVIQLQKNNAEAFLLRGVALGFLGKDAEAIRDFNRAVQLKNNYTDAYIQRGLYWQAHDDAEKALSDWEKAIKTKADCDEAYYYRGNLYYGQGEYAKAITELDKAINFNKKYKEAISLRAASKKYLGKYADAVADFDYLQQVLPDEFNDYFDRAESNMFLKKYKEAVADWDFLLKKQNDATNALVLRGVTKTALNWQKEAETDFQKALASTILKESTMAKIGCELVTHGQFKEALPWLDRVLADKPTHEMALKCRAQALKNLKN